MTEGCGDTAEGCGDTASTDRLRTLALAFGALPRATGVACTVATEPVPARGTSRAEGMAVTVGTVAAAGVSDVMGVSDPV